MFTLAIFVIRVLPPAQTTSVCMTVCCSCSHEELERCSRTVYVANIDKKVKREDVRDFFEHLCGKS